MSSEWEQITFGDFVSLQRGHDLPDQNRREGTVPILGSFGITGFHDTIKAKGPGVTIGRSGASFGVAVYSEVDYWPLNTALYVTDFKKNDPKFVFYFMKVFDFSSFNSGSAQPSLNRNNIYSTLVKIPQSSEQKQIASILTALDDRITLLRETNATLETITQALFKSWFVDFDPVRAKQEGREPEGMDANTAALFPDSFEESELGLVPKGWRIKRLGDITERITKGTTPTTLKRPFVESGINFIKVESLTTDGEFIPEKFAYIDDETHQLLKRSQLQVDDVLITIAGTIGRIAVMTEDYLPANTNQAVALIRPNSSLFPAGLIKHFLQRDDARQTMVERVVQAVQANLSLGSISDLKVAVPPSAVVKALHEKGIEQIDACKCMNQKHLRTLINIRDTLLPRLISGQLRLPEVKVIVTNANV